ncbi:protein indeterminate-domain 12-like [Diospyros lotus]|uniref:protein indeterminate-domain 12-like n=1 Tax=Diospyros lotus TaxID=55363 RepID=UPI00225AB765|nr:protein indeterminate-domain 12-like [Diospyros lotus]
MVQDFEEEDLIQSNGTHNFENSTPPTTSKTKRKRNQPGNPDPDAEVVALSPRTLMATNRYICEVCHKGFQRDQNLQLHRRGHNLPWKLKQRPSSSTSQQVNKRVFICPVPNCLHHHPSRALGDLTGIKKHFCRKHGDKKWKCDKCSKRYAVQSDWKAHLKICGTREYRCDCGTIFSRKDSFVTHRAFCDALAGGIHKTNQAQELLVSSMSTPPAACDSCTNTNPFMNLSISSDNTSPSMLSSVACSADGAMLYSDSNPNFNIRTGLACFGSTYTTSATALLQKAAEVGAKMSTDSSLNSILMSRFTAGGYSSSTGSMNMSGSAAPEASSSAGVYAANNNNHIAELIFHQKNTQGGDPPRGRSSSYSGYENGSLCDPSSLLMMQPSESNGIRNISWDRQPTVRLRQEGGRSLAATVDFLGIEPPPPPSFSPMRRSNDGDVMGELEYSPSW